MKGKTTRFLFSVTGLVLIIIGLICVGAVVASFTTNLVTLSEFGDSNIQVSLSQTATTIAQAQSATFSVTVQSLDSGYNIQSISTIWYIDGNLAGSGSQQLTFTGGDANIGAHTVSCTVAVSYDAGDVGYSQNYYPSGSIVVQPASTTAPTSGVQQIAVTTSVQSGVGSVVPSVGTHYYDTGSSITLIAYPGAGYVFSHWVFSDGTPSSTMQSYSMTLGHSFTASAVFVSTSNPTPTPISQTPTPTPIGQTSTPTAHPTVNPTPRGSSNPTDQTLLAVMAGLFIGAGIFLLWAKQYF